METRLRRCRSLPQQEPADQLPARRQSSAGRTSSGLAQAKPAPPQASANRTKSIGCSSVPKGGMSQRTVLRSQSSGREIRDGCSRTREQPLHCQKNVRQNSCFFESLRSDHDPRGRFRHVYCLSPSDHRRHFQFARCFLHTFVRSTRMSWWSSSASASALRRLRTLADLTVLLASR